MRSLLFLSLVLPVLAHAGPNRGSSTPPSQPLAQPATAAALPGDSEVLEIRRALEDLRGLVSTLRNPAMVAEMQRKITRVERRLAALDTTRWELIDTAAAFEAEALDCAIALDEARRPPARPRPPRERYREGWYPEPEPPPPGPLLTSPQDLSRIRAAVDDATFRKDKIATLRSATRDRAFSCDQVKALMGAFSFGTDKVEAAALLHDQVVDPQNWFTVYAALDFDSDRRKLRQRVGD